MLDGTLFDQRPLAFVERQRAAIAHYRAAVQYSERNALRAWSRRAVVSPREDSWRLPHGETRIGDYREELRNVVYDGTDTRSPRGGVSKMGLNGHLGRAGVCPCAGWHRVGQWAARGIKGSRGGYAAGRRSLPALDLV